MLLKVGHGGRHAVPSYASITWIRFTGLDVPRRNSQPSSRRTAGWLPEHWQIRAVCRNVKRRDVGPEMIFQKKETSRRLAKAARQQNSISFGFDHRNFMPSQNYGQHQSSSLATAICHQRGRHAGHSAVLQSLGSSPGGLTEAEAEARLEQYGPNEVGQEKKHEWLHRLWVAVRNPLVILLTVLAIVTFATAKAPSDSRRRGDAGDGGCWASRCVSCRKPRPTMRRPNSRR
jgi:hypothetical protein